MELFHKRFLSFIRESGHKGVIVRIRIKEEDGEVLSDHDEKSFKERKYTMP